MMVSNEEALTEQTPPEDPSPKKKRRRKKKKKAVEEAQLNQLDAVNHHEPVPKLSQEPEHSHPQLFFNSESNPELLELEHNPVPTPPKGLEHLPEAEPPQNPGHPQPQLFSNSESNSEHLELPHKPVPVPAPPKGLEHHPEHPKREPEPPQDPGHPQPQLFSNSESNPKNLELPHKPVPEPTKGSEHYPEPPKLEPEPPQNPGQPQPQLFPTSESNPEHIELPYELMPTPLINPGLKKRKRKKKKSVGNLEEAVAESNGLDAVQLELKPTPLKDPQCSQLFPKPQSNSGRHEIPNKPEPATPNDSTQKKSVGNLEETAAESNGRNAVLPELKATPSKDLECPQLFPKPESNLEHLKPATPTDSRQKKSVGNLEEAAAESYGLNAVQPELKPTPLKDPECPQLFPKPELNSVHHELPNKPEPATPTESRRKKSKRKKKSVGNLEDAAAESNGFDAVQLELKPTPLKDPQGSQLFPKPQSNSEHHEIPNKPEPATPNDSTQKKSVGNLEETAAESNGVNAVQPELKATPSKDLECPQLFPKPESNLEHRKPATPTDSRQKKSVDNLEKAAAESYGLNAVQPELKPTPLKDPECPQLFPKPELNSVHHELPNKPEPATPTESRRKKSKRKKSVGNLEDAAAESNGLNAVQPELKPTPSKDPERPQLFPKHESNSEHLELPNKPEPATPTDTRQKKSVGNLEEVAAELNRLNAVQPELKATPLKDSECPQLFPKPESNLEHHELPNKTEPTIPTDSRQKKSVGNVDNAAEESNGLNAVQNELNPTPSKDLESPQILPKSELNSEHHELPNEPEPAIPTDSRQKKRKRKKKSVGNLEVVVAESNGLNAVPPELKLPSKDPECPQLFPKPELNSEHHELPNKLEPAIPTDSRQKKSVGNLEEAAAESNGLNAVQPELKPTPSKDPECPPELNSEHHELPNKPEPTMPTDSRQKKSVSSLEEAAAESNGLSAVQPELRPTASKDQECPQVFPKSELNSEHHELPNNPEPATPTDSRQKKRKRKKKKSMGNHEVAVAESNRLNAVPPELKATPSKDSECPQLFPEPESNSEHHELPKKLEPASLTDSRQKKCVGNLEEAAAESSGLNAVQPEPKPTTSKDPECGKLFPKPELNSEHHELPNKPVPATPADSSHKKRKRKKKKSVGNLEEAAAESNGLNAVQLELKQTPLKHPECPPLFPKPESNSEHHEIPNKPERATPTDSRQKKRKRKKKKSVGNLEEAAALNRLNAVQPELKPTLSKYPVCPQLIPRAKSNSEHHELPSKPVPATPTDSRQKKRKRKKKSARNHEEVAAEWNRSCIVCQWNDHKASNCPWVKRLRDDEEICFFCAEIGHSLGECPRSIKGESQYAMCLACKNYGHVSRNCPQNVKGIDTPGGRPIAVCGPNDKTAGT